jgi:hypothetical protein
MAEGLLLTVTEADVSAETNGTTEWQMRNQFHAWSKFMTMSIPAAPLMTTPTDQERIDFVFWPVCA